MLTILPEKNEERIEKTVATAYAASGYSPNSGREPALLTVEENGKELGYLVIDVDKRNVRILDFQLFGCADYKNMDSNQTEYCDMMIRSAASYGLNRNLFRMESNLVSLYPLLKEYGFRKEIDAMGLDIFKLIGNCKNC